MVGTLRSGAQDVISPLQDVADSAISPVTDFFDSLGPWRRARGGERAAAAPERGAEGPDRGEPGARSPDAEALRELADLPDIADYDSVFASVVDGSTGNFERTFQIDQGSDDGIAKDMAVVVGAHGGALVGKVTSVSKSRATVQRIDDPQFGVVVQLLDPSGALGPTRVRAGYDATAAFLDLQIGTATQKLVKGEFAITRGSASRRSRAGSRWARSCAASIRRPRPRSMRLLRPDRRPRHAQHRQGAALPARRRPMIRRIRLGFVVIICVVLQTTLFTHLRIDGVAPDVGLVAVLAVAYYDGAESGRVVRFRDGARDRPVPHHAARALRARRTRSPATRWACSKRAWCADRPRSRRCSAASAASSVASCSSPSARVVGQSGFLSLASLKTVAIAAVYDAPDRTDRVPPRAAGGAPHPERSNVAGRRVTVAAPARVARAACTTMVRRGGGRIDFSRAAPGRLP